MAFLPVRATWLKSGYYADDTDGYWAITAYDSGVCTIEYKNPSHYMTIPE